MERSHGPWWVLLSSLALAALLLAGWPQAGVAASCPKKVMHIVAHEDDDLLFQSPELLEAIAAGDCVRTVFVTAGDAGLGETYWHGREEGSRAAYAIMGGVANIWTMSETEAAGHRVHLATLSARPTVSEVYMRLPDGGPAGAGFAATANTSLTKLWRSQNPDPASLSPITELTAVDGSATYTYSGLIATLAELMEEFEPNVISVQDFGESFGASDHDDHVSSARFAKLANSSYGEEDVLRSYLDYASEDEPVNVFEPQLGQKRRAYFAYAVHDTSEGCASEAECNEPENRSYREWLKRQILVSEGATPSASAGAPQSVASKALVTLDGSGSSDPLGQSLSYEWKQTTGAAVTLSSRSATKPTFTAPTGPTTLSFSLVVRNGEASSLPSTVSVTVAAPETHQLKVTKGGTGGGTVTSSPAGIECGTTCAASFDHGTEVTLTEVPAAGSTFVKWTNGCSGSGACKVTMSATKEVGAEFALVPKFNLKIKKTGNGAGTVTSSPAGISCGSDCEEEFEQGTQVTLSASPAANSEFKGFSGAGCTGTGPCKVTVTAAAEVSAEFTLERHQLKVTKPGNGSGTITSIPAGIECGSTCTANFDHGTEVTLSASPAAGSEFKGFSGGGCTGTGPCKVTMSAAKEVGAEFALERHQLKVTKGGTGAGTVASAPTGIECGPTCAANFDHGTEVTLTQSPKPGSTFIKWTGACTGSGACKVTMSAAKEVNAEFTLERHQLKVTKPGNGSGTITSIPAGIECGSTCTANFDHGTEVTLSASPAAGSEFKGFSGGGCSGTGPCKVTMSAAKEVGAEFALVPKFNLKIKKTGNGAGTVTSSPAGISCGSDCEEEFEQGTQVMLSASPSAGSEFKGFSGGGCSGTASCKVTISAAAEVSAEFVLERHQLKVTKPGNGSGTITSTPAGIECGSTCSANFDHGTEVTLFEAPATGSEFKGFSGGGCSGTGPCKVTMSAAKEVTAEFALERHQLKVTKSGNGAGVVTSAPTGIECGPTCVTSFDHGTEVTLTEVPAAGSTFVKWTGACTGSGACKVTMSAAREVGAEFALEEHQLKIIKGGNGSGSVISSPAGIECGPTCAANFDHGTEVTLTEVPAAGSEFKGFSGSGCTGTGPCKVTISAATEVTAGFALERHQLKVTKTGNGSGTVASSPTGVECGPTCSANFDHGTEVTLAQTPAAGSTFVKWTGACTGSGACKVTMSAAREVGAEFILEGHQLKITKSGNGNGTVTSIPAGIECGTTCAASFDYGTEVTLSAMPSAGSEFKGFSGGGCTGTAPCKVTISAATEVSAEFALERHQLKVTRSGNGSGTVTSSPTGIECGPTCLANFDHGTQVTLAATPGAGAEAAVWSGCDEIVGADECRVSMATAREVTATLDARPPAPLPPAGETVTAPDTRLAKAKVLSGKGKAKFVFNPEGAATRFECALAKTRTKPKYRVCTSPSAYQHLGSGRYTFKVRAVGPGGADATPASRTFRIVRAPAGATASSLASLLRLSF